jgi:hypothetical protein
MNKNTEFFGIDISKDVFDVYNKQTGHQILIMMHKALNHF